MGDVLAVIVIAGAIGMGVTVAIAETRGLIDGKGQSAGWALFGFFIPIIAVIVALLLPRRSDHV